MAWTAKATLSCLLRNDGLAALIAAITPFVLSSAIAGLTEAHNHSRGEESSRWQGTSSQRKDSVGESGGGFLPAQGSVLLR